MRNYSPALGCIRRSTICSWLTMRGLLRKWRNWKNLKRPRRMSDIHSLNGPRAECCANARLTTDMPMPYAIYILQCSDGTYYTGLTKDLDGRIHEHETGANRDSY